MHLVLGPIKPAIARWEIQGHGGVACHRRLHRRGAHERHRTQRGSVCCDDVAGFHDEALR
jgi:hypothetical protein